MTKLVYLSLGFYLLCVGVKYIKFKSKGEVFSQHKIITDLRFDDDSCGCHASPLLDITNSPTSTQIMNAYECNGKNISMRGKIDCSIQRGDL